MHADEETIERLAHGELRADNAPWRAHLEACAECRARVTEARGQDARVAALLRSLDHASPAVPAESIAARATVLRSERGRWAAGILLVLGAAGGVYALPNSPLRQWLRGSGAAESVAPVAAPAVGAPLADAPVVAGIALPADEVQSIAFAGPQAVADVTVTLIDGDEVAVRARGGTATFTSELDRLRIDNTRSSARYEIDVPRTMRRLAITAAGRTLVVVENGRIR